MMIPKLNQGKKTPPKKEEELQKTSRKRIFLATYVRRHTFPTQHYTLIRETSIILFQLQERKKFLKLHQKKIIIINLNIPP